MAERQNNRLIRRRLTGLIAGGVTLLDAVAVAHDQGREITLYFRHATAPEDIVLGDGLRLVDSQSIGSAPRLRCHSKASSGPIHLTLGGTAVSIEPFPSAADFLAGRNCALAVRNGETAQCVLDWLRFHSQTQNMTGALIYSRSEPGSDDKFERQLAKGLALIEAEMTVVLVDAPVPLGRLNLPPEMHPYCAPEAPGKDRMTLPDPDPWRAPLAEILIYEIARTRFLSTARTVANFDISDLIAAQGDHSVFDQANASLSGYIELSGQHCYPWRVRKNATPKFGDHSCVQFDASGTRRRWCIVPDRMDANAVWRHLRIGGATTEPEISHRFYRCMALRHPTDAISKIVPKASLVEHEPLIALTAKHFAPKPVRMPLKQSKPRQDTDNGRIVVVTTMKNEGPFILEWIAYHRAIGVDDFLIYTNIARTPPTVSCSCYSPKASSSTAKTPIRGLI